MSEDNEFCKATGTLSDTVPREGAPALPELSPLAEGAVETSGGPAASAGSITITADTVSRRVGEDGRVSWFIDVGTGEADGAAAVEVLKSEILRSRGDADTGYAPAAGSDGYDPTFNNISPPALGVATKFQTRTVVRFMPVAVDQTTGHLSLLYDGGAIPLAARVDENDKIVPTPTQVALVKGYRSLTQDELQLVNDGKDLGMLISGFVDRVKALPDADQRWAAEGRTDLQKGMMSLTRAITRPTNF